MRKGRSPFALTSSVSPRLRTVNSVFVKCVLKNSICGSASQPSIEHWHEFIGQTTFTDARVKRVAL